jgi:WD40 repeat protein
MSAMPLPVDTLEYLGQSPSLGEGGNAEPIISSAHDPETHHVVTCGYGMIRVWSTAGGHPKEEKTIILEAPKMAAERVSLSFGGVVCNHKKNLFIGLVNEKRGMKEMVSLRLISAPHGGEVHVANYDLHKVPSSNPGDNGWKELNKLNASCLTFHQGRQEFLMGDVHGGIWFWTCRVSASESSNGVPTCRLSQRLRIKDKEGLLSNMAIDEESNKVFGALQNGVKIWNFVNGDLLSRLPNCHTDPITSLSFCHATNELSTVGKGDKSPTIWKLPPAGQRQTLVLRVPEEETYVEGAFLLDNGRQQRGHTDLGGMEVGSFLFSLDDQRTLHMWSRLQNGTLFKSGGYSMLDAADGKQKKRGKKTASPRKRRTVVVGYSCMFSATTSSGRRMLVAVSAKGVGVFELHSRCSKACATTITAAPSAVTFVSRASVQKHSDNVCMLLSAEDLLVHTLVNGQHSEGAQIQLTPSDRGLLLDTQSMSAVAPLCVEYSEGLRAVLVGWSDGRVDIIAAATGVRLRMVYGSSNTYGEGLDPITALRTIQYTGDGEEQDASSVTLIFGGTASGEIHVWAISQYKQEKLQVLTAHNGEVVMLESVGAGRGRHTMLSASSDGEVKIWTVEATAHGCTISLAGYFTTTYRGASAFGMVGDRMLCCGFASGHVQLWAMPLIGSAAIASSRHALSSSKLHSGGVTSFDAHAQVDKVLRRESETHFSMLSTSHDCSVVLSTIIDGVIAAVRRFTFSQEPRFPQHHRLATGTVELLVMLGRQLCNLNHIPVAAPKKEILEVKIEEGHKKKHKKHHKKDKKDNAKEVIAPVSDLALGEVTGKPLLMDFHTKPPLLSHFADIHAPDAQLPTLDATADSPGESVDPGDGKMRLTVTLPGTGDNGLMSRLESPERESMPCLMMTEDMHRSPERSRPRRNMPPTQSMSALPSLWQQRPSTSPAGSPHAIRSEAAYLRSGGGDALAPMVSRPLTRPAQRTFEDGLKVIQRLHTAKSKGKYQTHINRSSADLQQTSRPFSQSDRPFTAPTHAASARPVSLEYGGAAPAEPLFGTQARARAEMESSGFESGFVDYDYEMDDSGSLWLDGIDAEQSSREHSQTLDATPSITQSSVFSADNPTAEGSVQSAQHAPTKGALRYPVSHTKPTILRKRLAYHRDATSSGFCGNGVGMAVPIGFSDRNQLEGSMLSEHATGKRAKHANSMKRNSKRQTLASTSISLSQVGNTFLLAHEQEVEDRYEEQQWEEVGAEDMTFEIESEEEEEEEFDEDEDEDDSDEDDYGGGGGSKKKGKKKKAVDPAVIEAERIEAERIEAERIEAERLEAERIELERLRKEEEERRRKAELERKRQEQSPLRWDQLTEDSQLAECLAALHDKIVRAAAQEHDIVLPSKEDATVSMCIDVETTQSTHSSLPQAVNTFDKTKWTHFKDWYLVEESIRDQFLERELVFASTDPAVVSEASAAGVAIVQEGDQEYADQTDPECEIEPVDPAAKRRWLQYRCWYWHGRKPKGDNPAVLDEIDFAEDSSETIGGQIWSCQSEESKQSKIVDPFLDSTTPL